MLVYIGKSHFRTDMFLCIGTTRLDLSLRVISVGDMQQGMFAVASQCWVAQASPIPGRSYC